MAVCPDGSYPNGDYCVKCQPSCLVCTSSGCQECAAGLILYQKQCVTTCPRGTYDVDGVCQACPSKCRDCVDAETCSECTWPSILQGTTCIDQCPASTYYSLTSQSCVLCSENCQVCTSPLQCQKCAPTYYLNPDGRCQQSCPSGSYISAATGKC